MPYVRARRTCRSEPTRNHALFDHVEYRFHRMRKRALVCAAGMAGNTTAMARVLVVTSSEIDPDLLAEVVSPDDDLHIVVPAVDQSRLQWLTNDEGDARDDALVVGESVGEAAPVEPASVDVKPDAPNQVLLDAIAEHQPHRIVLALREGEDASWLEDGQLDEISDEIDGIPVVRISV